MVNKHVKNIKINTFFWKTILLMLHPFEINEYSEIYYLGTQ